ncbi:MAG: MBL fold metallo-hydrolase [Bacteroidetes bacterium]|nr:MBL fold metallo-hydrolase [Bacteroidota bacterium]
MTTIKSFCFGPFSENTYLLINEDKKCWIIDPGFYGQNERNLFVNYLEQNEIQPVRLLNTHCHLDHIFGNDFLRKKYNLDLEIHPLEIPILAAAPQIGRMYGVPLDEQKPADLFIEDNAVLDFFGTQINVFLTPGHSPGSICFYNKKEQFIIVGDVLFNGSIGRTDLPGGDYDTLISSIKNRLLVLEDEVEVYNGHGPKTTIGNERRNNPFLN